MDISQILTFSQRILGEDVSRENDLLPVLSSRQKELLRGTGFQRVYFDPTTGKHPFLVTQSGVLGYDYPAWAIKVLHVYDAATARPEYNHFPGYAVTAKDAERKIVFPVDPGETTEAYRIYGIAGVPDITAENESLLVIPVDSRFPLLVCGIVSSFQPTHVTFGLKEWEEKKLDFRDELRSGASPVRKHVAIKTEWSWGNEQTVTDYRETA